MSTSTGSLSKFLVSISISRSMDSKLQSFYCLSSWGTCLLLLFRVLSLATVILYRPDSKSQGSNSTGAEILLTGTGLSLDLIRGRYIVWSGFLPIHPKQRHYYKETCSYCNSISLSTRVLLEHKKRKRNSFKAGLGYLKDLWEILTNNSERDL